MHRQSDNHAADLIHGQLNSMHSQASPSHQPVLVYRFPILGWVGQKPFFSNLPQKNFFMKLFVEIVAEPLLVFLSRWTHR